MFYLLCVPSPWTSNRNSVNLPHDIIEALSVRFNYKHARGGQKPPPCLRVFGRLRPTGGTVVRLKKTGSNHTQKVGTQFLKQRQKPANNRGLNGLFPIVPRSLLFEYSRGEVISQRTRSETIFIVIFPPSSTPKTRAVACRQPAHARLLGFCVAVPTTRCSSGIL